MRSLSFIVIAVLLALTAALPYNAPLQIPIHKRSTLTRDGVFDMEAARSHVAYSERKFLKGLAALERRTGIPPRSRALTRRTVSSESLTDDGNTRWYGTISVGSPAVEYTVDFDTGSSDLFLPGSNCGSTCSGHTLYNPNASSSAVDLQQNSVLSFGDGSSVSVELYTDTVSISGFTAKNQTFGAASQYSTDFESVNFPADGLMGMAFEEISVFGANSVMETLVAEGQLPDPVFAFKLASSGSEITIGGVNTALYTGSISYAPVTQKGYWQINLDSINANGQSVNTSLTAVVDTGTTFILGDTATVDQFYGVLNATDIGSGYYTMACDSMPDVSISVGGKPFSISAETFNLGSYNSSDSCIGAIVATGSLGDTWIMGDVFLQNVYTVFDLSQPQVGFADLA